MASVHAFVSSDGRPSPLMVSVATPSTPELVAAPERSPAARPAWYPARRAATYVHSSTTRHRAQAKITCGRPARLRPRKNLGPTPPPNPQRNITHNPDSTPIP